MILYASSIILCLGFVHSLNYEALIFDRTNRSLIKLPNEISNEDAKSGKWATACAAENSTTDEGKYNQEKSFYRNALFIRDMFTEAKLTIVLKSRKICKRPINLSLAVSFERNPVYYEFGYDINFNSIDSKNFEASASDRTKYISIEDFLKKATNTTPVEYLETHPELLKPQKKIDVIVERPVRAKLMTKEEMNEMGFIWIPLFKVISLKKQLRRIEYEIHRNNINPAVKCKNYDLGKEIYEGIKVDDFYSKAVQEKAFKPVDLKSLSEADKKCKENHSCFEKASLIPLDQYRFGPGMLKCSNMTTVPIWKNVVKGLLKKIDEFLYTLSRVSGRPLRITAGVYENLKLPTKRRDLIKNILLKNENSNLHVPEIIYKMVRIKSNNTCRSEDPGCWSGVLIVIHNHPNLSDKNKYRVCIDKSEELGWEEITYKSLSTKGPRSKNIYICSIEKTVLEEIELEFNKTVSMNDLSLKKFPYENGTAVEDVDMKTKVFNELKRVAEGGKIEIENDVIERPYLADDDFELVEIKKPEKKITKTENVKLMNEMEEEEEEKMEMGGEDEEEKNEEDAEDKQDKGEKQGEMEDSASEDGEDNDEDDVIEEENDQKNMEDAELKTEEKKGKKEGLEMTAGGRVDNQPDALHQPPAGKQKENLGNETEQDEGKKDSRIQTGERKVGKTNVQDGKESEK